VPVHQIVEVVPLVKLRRLAHAPEAIAGVLRYRDRLVPVIDLSQILRHQPSQNHLSTRIVLVNSTLGGALPEPAVVGLIAERVVETGNYAIDLSAQAGGAQVSYLGPILVEDQSMIQCLDSEALLTDWSGLLQPILQQTSEVLC
jgi:chemotaxis-related protein WspB